jgi:hypothetical protein
MCKRVTKIIVNLRKKNIVKFMQSLVYFSVAKNTVNTMSYFMIGGAK